MVESNFPITFNTSKISKMVFLLGRQFTSHLPRAEFLNLSKGIPGSRGPGRKNHQIIGLQQLQDWLLSLIRTSTGKTSWLPSTKGCQIGRFMEIPRNRPEKKQAEMWSVVFLAEFIGQVEVWTTLPIFIRFETSRLVEPDVCRQYSKINTQNYSKKYTILLSLCKYTQATWLFTIKPSEFVFQTNILPYMGVSKN